MCRCPYVWKGVRGWVLSEMLKIRIEEALAERKRKKEKKRKERKQAQKKRSHRSRHTHERRKINTNGKSEMALTESSCSECNMEMIISQYKQLVQDWNPPPVQYVLEGYDDQAWLFESKLSRNETKTSIAIVERKRKKEKKKTEREREQGEISQKKRSPHSRHRLERTKMNINGKSEMAPTESSCSECNMEMIISQYRQLVEDWNPFPVQYVLEGYGDQGWLFESKLLRNETKTSNAIGLEDSYHWSSTPYPYAEHLRQVDIDALPYILPY